MNAGRFVWVGLTVVMLAGCRRANSAAAPQQNSSPTKKVAVAPPTPSISVTGWKDLKWGDTRDQVKEKVARDGLVTCDKGLKSKDKGFEIIHHDCLPTKKDESGLTKVSLVFIDGQLGRAIVEYAGMTPSSSRVENLDRALSARYCPLKMPLFRAVEQAKNGNVGQSGQVQFACDTKEGDLFVSIKNGLEVSNVAIILTSDKYNQYLDKNEFSQTF